MQYREFLREVQARAHIESHHQALKACQATLETLSERIGGNEPAQLGAQLPPELGESLKQARFKEAERFNLDEFYNRVSERAGIPREHAIRHGKAVIAVLRDGVSRGKFHDVCAQLPPSFTPLYEPPHEAEPVS